MAKNIPSEAKAPEMAPELRLYDSIPDFLMKKDVGESCMLMMKAKVISKRISQNGKDIVLEVGDIKPHDMKSMDKSKLKERMSKMHNEKEY